MSTKYQIVNKLFNEQDEQLAQLLKTIQSQKEIAENINLELESQNKLLDETTNKVENTSENLKNSNFKINNFIKQTKKWWFW
jgi:hypothetical protein